MEFESTVGDLSSIKKVEKRVLASQTVSIDRIVYKQLASDEIFC